MYVKEILNRYGQMTAGDTVLCWRLEKGIWVIREIGEMIL